MTWTEDAVREALSCVEAEWTVRMSTSGTYATTRREDVRLELSAGTAHADIDFRWMRNGDTEQVYRSSLLSPSDIIPAINALRVLAVAAHGGDAWPWKMRETERERLERELVEVHHAMTEAAALPGDFGMAGPPEYWEAESHFEQTMRALSDHIIAETEKKL